MLCLHQPADPALGVVEKPVLQPVGLRFAQAEAYPHILPPRGGLPVGGKLFHLEIDGRVHSRGVQAAAGLVDLFVIQGVPDLEVELPGDKIQAGAPVPLDHDIADHRLSPLGDLKVHVGPGVGGVLQHAEGDGDVVVPLPVIQVLHFPDRFPQRFRVVDAAARGGDDHPEFVIVEDRVAGELELADDEQGALTDSDDGLPGVRAEFGGSDFRMEVPAVAVVARQKIGHLPGVDVKLAFEVRRRHECAERTGTDPLRARKGEGDFRVARTRVDVEPDPPPPVLPAHFRRDLGLEVTAFGQGTADDHRRLVHPLGFENPVRPRPRHPFADRFSQGEGPVVELHDRAGVDRDLQVDGPVPGFALQPDISLQEVLVEVESVQAVEPLLDFLEIVPVARPVPEPVDQVLVGTAFLSREVDRSDFEPGRPLARLPVRRRPSEAQVVAELEAVAVVLLLGGLGRQAPADVVLRRPDLIPPVDEVHGIDEAEIAGDILADSEAGARVRFRGDQARVDAEGAQVQRFARLVGDPLARLPGDQRQRLGPRHLHLPALGLGNGLAREEERQDIPFRKRRVGREQGGHPVRVPGQLEGDFVKVDLRLRLDVEFRFDAALVHQGDHPLVDVIGLLVEDDLPPFAESDAADDRWVRVASDQAEIGGGGLDPGDVVLHQQRGRGADGDVEPDPVQEGMGVLHEGHHLLGFEVVDQLSPDLDRFPVGAFHDPHVAADDDGVLLRFHGQVPAGGRFQPFGEVEKHILETGLEVDAVVDPAPVSDRTLYGHGAAVEDAGEFADEEGIGGEVQAHLHVVGRHPGGMERNLPVIHFRPARKYGGVERSCDPRVDAHFARRLHHPAESAEQPAVEEARDRQVERALRVHSRRARGLDPGFRAGEGETGDGGDAAADLDLDGVRLGKVDVVDLEGEVAEPDIGVQGPEVETFRLSPAPQRNQARNPSGEEPGRFRGEAIHFEREFGRPGPARKFQGERFGQQPEGKDARKREAPPSPVPRRPLQDQRSVPDLPPDRDPGHRGGGFGDGEGSVVQGEFPRDVVIPVGAGENDIDPEDPMESESARGRDDFAGVGQVELSFQTEVPFRRRLPNGEAAAKLERRSAAGQGERGGEFQGVFPVTEPGRRLGAHLEVSGARLKVFDQRLEP